jgi:hypothetical protein
VTALLDDVERLVRNGDATTIVQCCSPAGLELAATVLAADDTARRDFGTATAIAAYLAGLARPQLRAARRVLERPDDPPAMPLTVAAIVHGAVAQQRRQPPHPAAAPAEVCAATRPATAPAPDVQTVATAKLAAPTARADNSARRLTLAEAGTLLGMRLDTLPLTQSLASALADFGFDPRRSDAREVTLDGEHVARVARSRENLDALAQRIVGSVRSLCHVGGGGEVALHR